MLKFLKSLFAPSDVDKLEKQLICICNHTDSYDQAVERADMLIKTIKSYFESHPDEKIICINNYDSVLNTIPTINRRLEPADIAAFANNDFICDVSSADNTLFITNVTNDKVMKVLKIRYQALVTSERRDLSFEQYLTNFANQAIIANESLLVNQKEFIIPMSSLSTEYDWSNTENVDALKYAFTYLNLCAFVAEGNLHVYCPSVPSNFKIPENYGGK